MQGLEGSTLPAGRLLETLYVPHHDTELGGSKRVPAKE